eukprot:6811298-Prymnesium_polylepis.1
MRIDEAVRSVRRRDATESELLCGDRLDAMLAELDVMSQSHELTAELKVCTVCLDEIVPVPTTHDMGCVALTCGHEVHRACFEELIKKDHRNCPQCRAVMSYATH